MGGGSTTPLATYTYGYDNASRVTTQVNADGTYTYTYDNANELTAAYKNGTQVESYSYDSNGNRTGTGYSTTVMNETATSPGTTYTYDNAGNMITSKTGSTTTTYTYDYRNRLTEVTTGGTVVATYTYNAMNQRIGVKDNGTQTWTVYDGTSADANPYADFNSSGSLTERYLFGAGVVTGAVMPVILARTSSGGTTAWYLTDNLGSVRDIVGTSGNELDHIVYDSFGNIVTETNATNGDRFKFAAMQCDSTTGLQFDHARWYTAADGRFFTQDPLSFTAGDTNLYRYVRNTPLNAVDPNGMDGWGALGGGTVGVPVGGLAGAAGTFLVVGSIALVTATPIGWAGWTVVGIGAAGGAIMGGAYGAFRGSQVRGPVPGMYTAALNPNTYLLPFIIGVLIGLRLYRVPWPGNEGGFINW
jgi:RHS repeat-associated protein